MRKRNEVLYLYNFQFVLLAYSVFEFQIRHDIFTLMENYMMQCVRAIFGS